MKIFLFVLLILIPLSAFAQYDDVQSGTGFFGLDVTPGTTVQNAEVGAANEVRLACWKTTNAYVINTIAGVIADQGTVNCKVGFGLYDRKSLNIIAKNNDSMTCSGLYGQVIYDHIEPVFIDDSKHICQGFTVNEASINVVRGYWMNYTSALNYDALEWFKCANTSIDGILPDHCDEPLTALSGGQNAAVRFMFITE